MVSFPNAKINIGLRVIAKRNDGYHDLETVFYPVNWCDLLEIIPCKNSTAFSSGGLPITGDTFSNLCMKAWHLLKRDFKLPEIQMHLHKIIPMGAGLGGGSADAVYVLLLVNKIFNLQLSENTLKAYAIQLGSDCPFLINEPCIAKGRGEIIKPINLDLSGKYISIVQPDIQVSTATAFSSIKPETPENDLFGLIKKPIETWKNSIKNDFESSVFKKFPSIEQLKNKMYETGALYAAMSGSGSAVYGIFNQNSSLNDLPVGYQQWTGLLSPVQSLI